MILDFGHISRFLARFCDFNPICNRFQSEYEEQRREKRKYRRRLDDAEDALQKYYERYKQDVPANDDDSVVALVFFSARLLKSFMQSLAGKFGPTPVLQEALTLARTTVRRRLANSGALA